MTGSALALATAVLAIPAGRRPVWSVDEARYMVLAQDILDHDRWLVPQLRDRAYKNKPQLFFWAVTLASWPSGHVSERTAALAPLVSAAATVAGVVTIGTFLWGWPVGALAGLVLATTPAFFHLGHQVFADVMVTGWIVWALYFLLRARRQQWPLVPLVGFYVCVGLGMLSKGPMAAVALAAALVSTLADGGPGLLRRLRPGVGLIVLALTLAPWLGGYLIADEAGFARDVLVGHYGSWYLRGSLAGRLAALQALVGFLPWTVALLGAAVWWRRVPSPDRRFLVLWTATIWVIIGLSGEYRDRYYLPVYPGLALLTAEFLVEGVRHRGERIVLAVARVAAVLAVLTAAAVVSPLPRLLRKEAAAYAPGSLAEGLGMAVLIAGGGVFFGLAARRGRPALGAVGFALAIAGVLVVVGINYPPRYGDAVDIRMLAAVARAHTPRDGAVFVYPDARLAFDFYVRRRIVKVNRQELELLLQAPSQGALILWQADWLVARAMAEPSWRVQAEREVAGRSLVVVGSGARGGAAW